MSEPKALIGLKVGAKGVYHVQIRRNAGTPEEYIEDCGKHKNKIVNQGLNWWGSTTGFATQWSGLAVGTGNSVPSATDTVLANPLAFLNSSGAGGFSSSVNTAPYSITYGITYTFAVGAVIGNVAELGTLIATTPSAGGALFSRALIQVGGSPGTITVTASDQLIVTYQVQIGFAAETSGSFTLTTDGVTSTINWQCLPINFGNNANFAGGPIKPAYDGFTYLTFQNNLTSFYPVTQANEFQGNGYNPAAAAYVANSFSLTFTAHSGTGGSSTAVYQLVGLVTTLFGFQFLLSPAISKLTTQTLDITYNMTWADVT